MSDFRRKSVWRRIGRQPESKASSIDSWPIRKSIYCWLWVYSVPTTWHAAAPCPSQYLRPMFSVGESRVFPLKFESARCHARER